MSKANQNESAIPNIHLIFTSFLTNRRLSDSSFDYNKNDYKCVNQFFTSIHSMYNLGIKSQSFYLEIDENFLSLKGLIKETILFYFPKAKLIWKRLEYFNDWNKSVKDIPKNSELILLQSNFDHAYIAKDVKLFSIFANQLKRVDSRSIGEITHWPEALSEISKPWTRGQELIIEENYFQRNTDRVVGTSLISKKLYEEIWRNDFTQGKRITRPDNPFGPSVKFRPAVHLSPKHELFRHLDGYLHVGINSKWVKELSPCCIFVNNSITHSGWNFCSAKNLSKVSLKCDLPDDEELYAGLPINKILKSISHRINYEVMRNLIPESDKNKWNQNLVLTSILVKFPLFWSKLPRFILDVSIGNILVNSLVRNGESARSNFILSRIMSNGWASLIKLDFFKIILYKVALILKLI